MGFIEPPSHLDVIFVLAHPAPDIIMTVALVFEATIDLASSSLLMHTLQAPSGCLQTRKRSRDSCDSVCGDLSLGGVHSYWPFLYLGIIFGSNGCVKYRPVCRSTRTTYHPGHLPGFDTLKGPSLSRMGVTSGYSCSVLSAREALLPNIRIDPHDRHVTC